MLGSRKASVHASLPSFMFSLLFTFVVIFSGCVWRTTQTHRLLFFCLLYSATINYFSNKLYHVLPYENGVLTKLQHCGIATHLQEMPHYNISLKGPKNTKENKNIKHMFTHVHFLII